MYSLFLRNKFLQERPKNKWFSFFVYFLGGLGCVGPTFAYVAHFVFLGDDWIRTQIAAGASNCTTNLATHLPKSSPQVAYPDNGARKRRMKAHTWAPLKGLTDEMDLAFDVMYRYLGLNRGWAIF